MVSKQKITLQVTLIVGLLNLLYYCDIVPNTFHYKPGLLAIYRRFVNQHDSVVQKSIQSDAIISSQACRYPHIDPFNAKATTLIDKPEKLECNSAHYGRMDGNTLSLNVTGLKEVKLYYIRRLNDFHQELSSPQVIYARGNTASDTLKASGTIQHVLEEEFIKLELTNIQNKNFVEFHMAFFQNKTKHQRKGNKTSILMLMIDSVSEPAAQRYLKKTYSYLEKDPNTVILKQHSIVGDGTTAQVGAILTGTTEKNLPEARRRMKGAKKLDGWPWVFKELHEQDYLTLYSEDSFYIGTFQFRLTGFDKPPTSYYPRPLWAHVDYSDICSFNLNLEMAKQFYRTHPNENKFSIHISDIVHGSQQNLVNIDDGIYQFYEELRKSGHLDNTVVILFGDHGPRAGKYREETLQGKLEERLPFVAITIPPWFNKHTKLVQNLKQNSQVLTTHFDLHSTLHHIATFPHLNNKTTTTYGTSLFNNIAELNRTCGDAFVDPHWCLCLKFKTLPITNSIAVTVTKHIIDYINELNEKHAEGKCEKLVLERVSYAQQSMINQQVKQYKGTSMNDRCDDCGVVYREDSRMSRYSYETVFEVSPSGGKYEVTVDCQVDSQGNVTNCGVPEISRINLYGEQSRCIHSVAPLLRKYCFCKKKPVG